ncbi:molybdate ABC transporter substrate-binding protein [Cellvibrio sp. UBA7661]|uniref:molybdate ABC transporter substrate-binding protein n=1 Tax=Cellvibrio sp. UBA7661 TaxID=1946311 RepID=UPI002F35D5B8
MRNKSVSKKNWRLLVNRVLGASLVFCAVTLQAAEVRVYAAASLSDVLTELATSYQQAHPDIQIKSSFAGSSTLAKQIENGAPADVFISADKDWADYLQTRGLLNEKNRVDLLTNELVLIAPEKRAPAISMNKNADLASSFNGKLCTGEPAYVPVGKYAKQALDYFGWWDSIQPRLVGTEDVRTALAFVERGECALGVVYKTDAQLSKKVIVVASFPAESHLPIVYPGGLTKNAVPEADAFWQFLQSAAAQEIFIRYGFGVLKNN